MAESSSANVARPHLPFSRPCISEAAALDVADVVRSGWITSGPKVAQFERDFQTLSGAAHAIAVCSATAGLDLAVAALDLQPGDEVIVPSMNWVSGPNMIELNGGTCVFAEVDAGTLNIDLHHVERLLSPRTRAVMPVHFAGQPVDIPRLRALIGARPIAIIEDAAHAAGARFAGKPIGADSDIAVFSFHPTKNLTTAEGGMIVCRDAALADRLRLGRFHGIRKDAWKNHARSGSDAYHVLMPARKYNLTDIQATLGIHQLRDLDRMNIERDRLARRYLQLLANVPVVETLRVSDAADTVHSWHIFVVKLRADRAAVCAHLERLGIGTGLHYPAVHAQTYYAQKYPNVCLPVTEDAGARVLSLPLFPGLSDADQDRVVAALRTFPNENPA